MRGDMHVYSVYSDGLFSPYAIAERAKRAGLAFFSITDHDSMEGAEEKQRAALEFGLSFVHGWEISAYEDVKIHVLGYGCARNGAYTDFLEARKESGIARALDMVGRGNEIFKTNVRFSDVEKERLKKDAPVHTMHVVRAFSKQTGKSVGELYEGYFQKGKPAYSGLMRPSPVQAIDVIHKTGGIAVLAHPGRIQKTEKEKEALISRLVSAGLDGIECVYTTHTQRETEYFQSLACAHRLLQTGGSDFHFDDGKVQIGSPFFEASHALMERLKLR